MHRSRLLSIRRNRSRGRAAAVVAVATVVVGLAAGGSAQAATLTQAYKCMYPLVGIRSEVLTVSGSFPATSPLGEPTPAVPLSVKLVSTQPDKAFEPVVMGATASAEMTARTTFTESDGFARPIRSQFHLDGSSADDRSISLAGVWNFPSVESDVAGQAHVTFDRFTLNQTLRRADGTAIKMKLSTKDIDGNPTTDSDGDPDTFDVSCKPDAGQPTKLGEFFFVDPSATTLTQTVKCAYPVFGIRGATLTVSGRFPATTPAGVATAPVPLSVRLTPNAGKSFEPVIMASTGEAELDFRGTLTLPSGLTSSVRRQIHLDGSPGVEDTVALGGVGAFPSQTFDGLGVVPINIGKFSLNQKLRSSGGEIIQMPQLTKDVDGSVWQPLDNNPDTFDVSCWPDAGQPTKIGEFNVVGADWTRAFAATGSSTVPKLVQGTVPLKGSATLKYTEADKSVTSSDLVFAQSKARLLSLGAAPIVARVGFVRAGPVTGTLVDGALSLTATVRIKVLDASLYGAIPIETGNSCQSKQLSTITLKSTGAFSPETGATLTGTFPISDLNGCALLNGLVSPLIASDANTITLKLAP